MVCASLRHRGEELLAQRRGLEAYATTGSTMGIPLLYPWANRLSQRRFEVAGETVDLDRAPGRFRDDGETGLPIHGVIGAGGAWTVEDGGERALRASFDWAAHEDLMAAYPFAHRVRYEADLDEQRLRVAVSVDRRVPVAFGLHPYFVLPGGARVQAPLRERLCLDERKLPTGAREPAAPLAGTLRDGGYDDAYVAPRGPFVLESAERTLTVRFDGGFPFAQVFAPPGEGLVSFEPMTAPGDALVTGADLPLGPHAAAFEIEVE